MLLSREQHCALAKLSVESFKTLQRLMRLPQVPAELRHGDGYSPLETLMLMVADEFANRFGMSRTKAAEICSDVAAVLLKWDAIRKSSEDLMLDKTPAGGEVEFGRIELPYQRGHPGFVSVCGTAAEIGTSHRSRISIVGLSISRVATLLRIRAARLQIDLGNFWADPLPPPAARKRKRSNKKAGARR